MALIDLRMILNVGAGEALPELRAFIDLQPDRGLASEIELPLRRRGKHEWVGTFAVGENQPRYFLYRVALAAHVGASWELLIRERGSDTPLLADADTVTLAKCWLVGSCDAPGEHKRISAQPAPGSATGATARGLLLAPTLGPACHLAYERLKASQRREAQHARTRNASEQRRLFVLGEPSDQGVRTVDERPRKPQRDDPGV